MDAHDLFDSGDDGLVLRVHCITGAGRAQVMGTQANELKVRVAAAPATERANAAVCQLVATSLDVDGASVSVIDGDRSRSKRVLIVGAEPDQLARTVDELIARSVRRDTRDDRSRRTPR